MRLTNCEVRIQCQRQLYGMAGTIIRRWERCSVPSVDPDALPSLVIPVCEALLGIYCTFEMEFCAT